MVAAGAVRTVATAAHTTKTAVAHDPRESMPLLTSPPVPSRRGTAADATTPSGHPETIGGPGSGDTGHPARYQVSPVVVNIGNTLRTIRVYPQPGRERAADVPAPQTLVMVRSRRPKADSTCSSCSRPSGSVDRPSSRRRTARCHSPNPSGTNRTRCYRRHSRQRRHSARMRSPKDLLSDVIFA
jgi:hypothetical protein